MRGGRWRAWVPCEFRGKDEAGGPLGIFGMGGVGRILARRARGFDMQIRYHNRSRLPFDREASATYYTTPEGLLAASPFLALTAPSTPETRGFLDAERIALLPDGAVVVNVASGDLVDGDALVAAVNAGKGSA